MVLRLLPHVTHLALHQVTLHCTQQQLPQVGHRLLLSLLRHSSPDLQLLLVKEVRATIDH